MPREHTWTPHDFQKHKIGRLAAGKVGLQEDKGSYESPIRQYSQRIDAQACIIMPQLYIDFAKHRRCLHCYIQISPEDVASF